MDTQQFSLEGFEQPVEDEMRFLNALLPRMEKSVEAAGSAGELLSIAVRQSYTVVSLYKFTIFRLRLRGKRHYIASHDRFADMIPSDWPVKKVKSDEKYTRIYVDDNHPLGSYSDFLVDIAGECVNRYPHEWDCCSRYMECSNARACVHPDKAAALDCGYRKILKSGRIFYGTNRNID